MQSALSFPVESLTIAGKSYRYHPLNAVPTQARLPFSLKVLFENLLRHHDGETVTAADIAFLQAWQPGQNQAREISFVPSRVLMQDFTGVPAVADLAAMRDALQAAGVAPNRVNPLQAVELVIDHSVQVDHFGRDEALEANVSLEYQRNRERYEFLKWAQGSLQNFAVVPPGVGIVHQVNLEYLARVVCVGTEGLLYPDTVVGTDSHTTMINGLGVLGWGVGGIEAEAAMLGQPVSMLLPPVVGVELHGCLPVGVTATDLVLTIVAQLRKHGVVGKFVEFYGEGLGQLSLADRATIANMAPEYGATCGFFPIDAKTLAFLELSGRDPEQVARVEAYARAQGLFYVSGQAAPEYDESCRVDLSAVLPSLAGPRRPQDRVALAEVRQSVLAQVEKSTHQSVSHGILAIAAITSCTNTSNPSVMLAAGLLAQKARRLGLMVPSWVKTSLAPGSQVVADYLSRAGLLVPLAELGFQVVGFGCTTCIGNSGPLVPELSARIKEENLLACAVLSGNRNFEGRVHPEVRLNYLASPPLVVAYALAGRMDIDLTTEPLGHDSQGQAVYLRDIWPTAAEITGLENEHLRPELFRNRYRTVFAGDSAWQGLQAPVGQLFPWRSDSTYIRQPPYFLDHPSPQTGPLNVTLTGLRALAVLGDSITTDHISPAGSIKVDSPAGHYLRAQGVAPEDFNAYGARRGNHEVMVRGTFANQRLRNLLAQGREGGWTRYQPGGELMTIYDAAVRYQQDEVPLLIIAGKEYGSGSSRDWAAKGPKLLGVRVVLAESYERIHRSNLVGMGILPLEFNPGDSAASLGLTGQELFEVRALDQIVTVQAQFVDGRQLTFPVRLRIDTPRELAYYQHGGILPYVLAARLAG